MKAKMWYFLIGVNTGSSFKFQTTSFPEFLNLLCHSYVPTRFSNYHSLEKHLLASASFLSWGKKKWLAAALFMSDGYTVYILKHLECEQLPLLLSHQVSYTLYKLLFYYQRNVSLSLLTPSGLGIARLAPKASPTCRQLRLSTVHHLRLWQPHSHGWVVPPS